MNRYTNNKVKKKQPVDLVNPDIGGMAHLLVPTLPLVHLPNSMMRIARQPQGYDKEYISYFPVNIISHRMGTAGKIMITSGEVNTDPETWKSACDHDFESTHPYSYSVLLEDHDISLDLTATAHAAFYQFHSKKDTPLNLYFQVQKEGCIHIIPEKKMIRGFDNIGGIKIYFIIVIENAIEQYGTFHGEQRLDNQDRIEGQNAGGYISFSGKADQLLRLKLAVSYLSIEQAERHLSSEIPDWGFEELVSENRLVWSKALDKIKISGGSENERAAFYTALYRCLERMVNISEEGRYFSCYDNSVHNDEGDAFYVDDWAWDTYRAQHPLQILLNPNEQRNKIKSYLRIFEQSGSIPLFPTVIGDLACMNGNHPSAIVADAWFKGIRDFDVEKLYEGLKKRQLESTMLPWCNGPATELDEFHHKNGYFPALRSDQQEWVKEVDDFEKRQSVAVTLGHSYDDWCLAMLARELGRQDDYDLFLKKSDNYKNLFDPESGFFAPRDHDGNWIRPFDPKFGGGFGGRDYYAENNAWTYLFDVQHDVQGLIQLLGGKEKFIARLDALFTEECGIRKSTYFAQFPDATGLIGQFAMGNEPSLHIPYLYNYAGAPWKTQKRIRMLMDLWFTNSPFGMCGDEDGGGISSFYVFSSMGFYPVTPGAPYYAIGSPLFDTVEIDLGGGKYFVIEANNSSKQNKYIQRAELNGKKLENPYFSHNDIANGGKLTLEMGPRPNYDWGKESEGPYSKSSDE